MVQSDRYFLMEKTGSVKYKKRRVLLKAKKNWSNLEGCKLFQFDDISEDIQNSVLQKIDLQNDDLPIIFSYTDSQDWCLLSIYHVVFENECQITHIPIEQIAEIGPAWGNLSEKDKVEKCEGKAKLSPWLYFETYSGERFEVFIWDKFTFWQGLKLLQELHQIHPRAADMRESDNLCAMFSKRVSIAFSPILRFLIGHKNFNKLRARSMESVKTELKSSS